MIPDEAIERAEFHVLSYSRLLAAEIDRATDGANFELYAILMEAQDAMLAILDALEARDGDDD